MQKVSYLADRPAARARHSESVLVCVSIKDMRQVIAAAEAFIDVIQFGQCSRADYNHFMGNVRKALAASDQSLEPCNEPSN